STIYSQNKKIDLGLQDISHLHFTYQGQQHFKPFPLISEIKGKLFVVFVTSNYLFFDFIN
ncbi:hypothetical protein ACJX0J_013017, partial [Zea mays]